MLPIVNPIKPWLSGWNRRKLFEVTSTHESRDRIMDMKVYNTSGTDAAGEIYLDGNVRSDWGDLRITSQDGLTPINFGIIQRNATYIVISIRLNVIIGDRNFYLYYDGPAADIFKIGRTTDQHYDPDGASGGASEQDRVNTITKLQAFNTRMGIYLPDLILHGGDHAGAQSSVEATQLSWMEDVFDECHNGPVGIPVRIVSPGNHDFEFVSLANFRALLDNYEAWLEASVCYGKCFENDDYIILSMDAQDTSTGHQSISHVGNGFIGNPQMNWLYTQLVAATKPVIIDIHQPCAEQDTEQFTLTKALYHTQNRKDFRNIIEQSGKVIAVLHGHMHFTRVDCIRGIPYLVGTNLTDDGAFDEVPLTTDGKWCEIEFDKSSQMINLKHVALIAGNYETIYEFNMPFGRTQFFTDNLGGNADEVFKNGWGGGFAKGDYIRDPTEMYVVNSTFLYKFPVNHYTPDPLVMKNSIRINGRTSSPNFGRSLWQFKNISTPFIIKFWFMMDSTTEEKGIKVGGTDTSGTPLIYFAFKSDGNIHCFHDTGPTDTVIMAYAANTVYEFEIFPEPANGGYNALINGTPVLNKDFYGPTITDAKFRQVEILTEAGDCWLQGLTIRDWILPRPTFGSVGNEETP